ncbi:MAG: porin family protein [Devosia sp.]|uniref:outer membrane protein n=1 Tax=Devosia sp. TaxID=1871048 RepID=UPI003390C015
MKKLFAALALTVAITGSASAADLAARPYTKAPMAPAPTYSWTGFYIFGGGGGGIWSANGGVDVTATGACIICTNTRTGGDGWFGTVGAGYDWQSAGWVFGIFGDGTFGSLKGNIGDASSLNALVPAVGTVKMETAWAAGARVGYLVAPNVLSYVNGGYTGTYWSGSTLLSSFTGTPTGFHTDGFNTQGWFVGGGVENNLNIFGINAPGWFMKTEYRAAYLDRKNLQERVDGTGAPTGINITFKPFVQTISTSLVYRFNWTGVASRY